MNCMDTGKLIKALRIDKKMTQLELAQKLSVSDKTVSKWERGLGMPDVSLISEIAEIFGTTAEKILSGKLDENKYNGANINRLEFMYCDHCGNVLTTTAKAEVSCCGRKPLTLKRIRSEEIVKDIDIVEDEYFVILDSPMTKQKFVTFVAVRSFDKFLMFRLYPEQNPHIRVPISVRGEFLVGLNEGKMFSCDLDKIFLKKLKKVLDK